MKLGTLLSMVAMAVMGMGLALPAQAADPIKIGVYLPLTGQNAFGGQLELEGIQLAHKLKPTVLDRPVELVVVDNKSDKVEAANAVKRLTEHEKVLAIIGTYGSSLAMAGGEVAERAKVPVIGTSCQPLVTQGKKYYFAPASSRSIRCRRRDLRLQEPRLQEGRRPHRRRQRLRRGPLQLLQKDL